MKDNIDVLWEQAGGIVEASWPSYRINNIEAFAESIVDQCCLKLLEMDEKTRGNHNYYKHAAVELKRHFGVE